LPQPPQSKVLLLVSTQAPLQSVWPGGHWQVEPLQTWSKRQVLPQAPQWPRSEVRSAQVKPQRVRPGGQPHRPPAQGCPLQTLPQKPQLAGSLV
jgi:hypothetical protein